MATIVWQAVTMEWPNQSLQEQYVNMLLQSDSKHWQIRGYN